uniref:Uncharacterized protein n=1 Tax=Rhizophora mucronata TaxID=61149 RepID=A0A2P2N635_RHIMU
MFGCMLQSSQSSESHKIWTGSTIHLRKR